MINSLLYYSITIIRNFNGSIGSTCLDLQFRSFNLSPTLRCPSAMGRCCGRAAEQQPVSSLRNWCQEQLPKQKRMMVASGSQANSGNGKHDENKNGNDGENDGDNAVDDAGKNATAQN